MATKAMVIKDIGEELVVAIIAIAPYVVVVLHELYLRMHWIPNYGRKNGACNKMILTILIES